MILFLKRLHSLNYTFIQTQDFFFMNETLLWVHVFELSNETAPWIDLREQTPLEDEFLSSDSLKMLGIPTEQCLVDVWYRMSLLFIKATRMPIRLCAYTNCCCFRKMNHLSIVGRRKKSRNLHNMTIKIVFLSWHFRKTKRSKCQAIIKNDLTIKLHISTAADCYYRFRYETFNDWVIAALIRSAPITFSTNSYAHAEVFFLSKQVLRNL